MITITATELKRSFGKYVILGQKERTEVTHRGKTIFTIVPQKEVLFSEWENLFGILPKETLDDDKIDRE